MMTAALISIAAALFLAVCIMNRALATAVFAAALPAYLLRFTVPLGGLAIPTTLLEICFWELFLAWILMDGRKGIDWRAWNRWSFGIALVFIGGIVGVIVSPDLRSALGLWRAYILEPLLFFLLFTNVVADGKRRAMVLAGLGASLTIVGITAVYQKITGFGIPDPWQAAETRRVTSFYGFPNAVGLFAAPVVILMIGWGTAFLRFGRGREKAWAALPFLAAALGASAIAFAVSEGAIIGAAAGLVALGLLIRPLRAPALLLLIAASLVVTLYRPATNYAAGIYGFSDQSGSVRKIIWRETTDMLADHPVFGAGLAGYRTRIAPYHEAEHIEIFMYPHNIALNFWSEIGLIGLLGFLLVFARALMTGATLARERPNSWMPAACFAAVVAILVHGSVDVPYFKNDLAFLFWTLIGLMESSRLYFKPKS